MVDGTHLDQTALLSELWTDRIRQIATTLANGQAEHREIANLAEHIGQDYHGRFLLELLQNAGDQNLKAGITDGLAVIVTAPGLIAVGNSGAPFDTAGVESITSLGLSGKDAAVYVGNKGVGFKSVYQITDQPELYSNFQDGDAALRLVLSRTPFADSDLLKHTEQTLATLQQGYPGIWSLLEKRHKTPAAIIQAIQDGVRQAAPFKFPVPLPPGALTERLEALQLPDAIRARLSTLVVLPVLPEQEEVVRDALKSLLDDHGLRGSMLLFTEGISELVVLDRVEDQETRLKRSLHTTHSLPASATQLTTVTTTSNDSLPQQWLCARRVLGTPAEGVDAKAEQDRIQAATSTLPGEGWAKVRTAPVTVALPLPADTSGSPLGCRGRLTIALPTRDTTGSPWWIDARFHGNISRTGIDLTSTYNRLLFAEAVRLIGALLDHLRDSTELDERRLVTLSMELQHGPLRDALCAEGGIAHGPVVLGYDGTSFHTIEQLRLFPREVTRTPWVLLAMIEGLTNGELTAAGLRLPERSLMARSHELLDSLAGMVGREALYPDKAMLLKRNTSGPTWLERIAQTIHPDKRHTWHPFLKWLEHRFTTEEIETQRILPTTTGSLAASVERVFLLPPPGDLTDDDARLEDIPESVKKTLRFIDETCIHIRVNDTRRLTWAGVLLSPARGTPLVRRPRLDQLLNYALGPRLKQAIREGDDTLADLLLSQAVRWLSQMSDVGHQTVQESGGLMMPDDAGGWSSSMTLYFSRGWLERKMDEDALIEAYQETPGLVLRWSALHARLGLSDEDREGIRLAFAGAGVRQNPRLLRFTGKRQAPLRCQWDNRFQREDGVQSPFQDITIAAQWSRYMDHIAAMIEAPTRSGFGYQIGNLQWLEGLEHPDSRAAVVRLLLAHPTEYLSALKTDIRRADGKIYNGRPEVETLWVHALRTAGWPCFPTDNHGLCASDAIWLLSESERRRRSYGLLRVISADPGEHGLLLTALGIPSLQSAPLDRLAELLHEVATGLAMGPPLLPRDTVALLGDIYTRIAALLQQDPALNLAPFLANDLPLLRGPDTLTAASLLTLDEPLYIVNDPVRCRFIPDWLTTLRVPGIGRVQSPAAALAASLNAHTQPGQVILTSAVVVDTGFEPDTVPSERLLSWMETSSGAGLLVELGLILAYGTAQQADLTSERSRFHLTWKQLKSTQIRLGNFPAASQTDAFYDKPTLDLTARLADDPLTVIPHLWLIMGPAYRDILSAYAHARRAGGSTRFFMERQLGPEQFDAVEAAIGRSDRLLAQRFQSALLVFWLHAALGQPSDIQRFRSELRARGGDLTRLSIYLRQPTLGEHLQQLRDTPEGPAHVTLLKDIPDGIARWQQARALLGGAPFQFPSSREALTSARPVLAWGMMSAAARCKGTDIPGLGLALTAWLQRPLPPDLLCIDPGLLPATRRWAREQLRTHLPPALAGLLTATGLPGLAVDRDRYRTVNTASRAIEAERAWQDILRVAEAVAAKAGESLPASSPALETYLKPPWANWRCALAVGARLIESTAEVTAALLEEQGAFEKRIPWRELWTNLSEHIGPPPAPVPPAPKPIQLIGTTLSQAHFKEQFLSGSTGPIGSTLKDAAADSLNFDDLRGKHSRLPQPTAPSKESKKSRVGKPNPGAQNTQEIGALGEAFVYEQLRKLDLPGFDASCWVSSAAAAYGIQGLSDDGCGYDFLYRDPTGKLIGRPALCLIEVKSTVKSGQGSFIVSINEWQVAQDCHHSSDDRVYLIIRVGQMRHTPEITDILVDPVAMEARGEIRLSGQALKVTVGAPVKK